MRYHASVIELEIDAPPGIQLFCSPSYFTAHSRLSSSILSKVKTFLFAKIITILVLYNIYIVFCVMERYWRTNSRESALLPLKLLKAQKCQRNNVFRFVFCGAIPIFPITATIPYSWCVTSGANTSLHTLYPPNVSHQEITNLLYTAIYGTFPFS